MYVRALATPHGAVDNHRSVLYPTTLAGDHQINYEFRSREVAPKLPWALKICQMQLRFGLILDAQIGYGFMPP